MHIKEAASRVRDALKRRTGRSWSVRMHREGRQVVGILISVGSRYGDSDNMSAGERQELARLLDLQTRQVGASGVLFGNDQLEDAVDRSEFGLRLS